VAGYLPNRPETVVAMLAATSLGAVWSSCSPDFGTQAVVERFGQIEPKLLFAAEEAIRAEIRRRLREQASPRHVPNKVLAVSDIPRTISGKISEIAIRNVIHGHPVVNQDALANPESLKLFEGLEPLSN